MDQQQFNPWFFNPWWAFFGSPFSGNMGSSAFTGNVAKDINPITSLMSPSFEFNFAGNRRIEGKVVSDVASYGKQLGKLSEAVLELANGEKGEAVAELEKLVAKIEAVKTLDDKDSLKDRMDAFKKAEPEAFRKLLASYR